MESAQSSPRIIGTANSPIFPGAHPRVCDLQCPRETRPCFTSTWIRGRERLNGRLISSYKVGRVGITISVPEGATCAEYEVNPPEYSLASWTVKAVAETISEMTASSPPDIDFRTIEAMRPYIEARAKDVLYSRLEGERGAVASDGVAVDAEYLAEIVAKYTIGFGALETLIDDSAVQDIYVNAPSSQTPVFVVLRSDDVRGVGQKCRTNVFMGVDDLRSIVSRIKLETGLPFSEANPVLEADISRLGCRFTLIGPPISDRGVSLAIRKHARSVLTLPALIRRGTLSPLLSGFLWACILGRRSILVAGSRGAGKTTLLGSMMMEFPLTQRILLIEDTPEIPATRMRQLGYDIVALRFGDAESPGSVSADDALRVSLRMGESAIVIGEVRGSEAKVLYESMRAGSAGSAVLGTIHGNSAKGVLDRAVEDLGVSERAFSSTDLVIVVDLARSPDGSTLCRRVREVAEVRYSHGSTELISLFTVPAGGESAEPTEALNNESKTIAGISQALALSREKVLSGVFLKAACDARMAGGGSMWPHCHPEDDRTRILSNEIILKCILSGDDPEKALNSWESSHGQTRA